MKKTLLTLFAVAFVASVCFAAETSVLSSVTNRSNLTQSSSNVAAPAQTSSAAVVPTNNTLAAPVGTTTFTGKVGSVSSGSGISGTSPQITVIDDQGQSTIFVVASGATIIGKDGSSTSLNWIDKDDKVSIEYIANQDGTKTAKSIKVSAGW
jgi:hypothetical protein